MRLTIPRMAGVAAVGAAAAAVAFVAVGTEHSTAARGVSTSASVPSTHTISHTTLTASGVYKQDSAGVVAITATSSSQQDSGTGIVLDNNGTILTNDHVVSGASSVTVAPGASPSNTRTATVVGEDPDSDLAVLKVDPSGLGLKPLTFADSSGVSVGDAVYAIGNPYGLDETLTRGIVSALGRQISAPDGATINGAIQTDAALNPGNSGGPLLNDQGQVIGVNSQIASEQSDSSGSQPGSTGVGFAISSNTAAQIVQKIESTGGSIPSTQQNQSSAGAQSSTDPYGQGQTTDPYGQAQTTDPYGQGQTTDPYGQGQTTDPYGAASPYGSSSDPYGQSTSPYGSSQSGASPYGYGSGGGTIVLP